MLKIFVVITTLFIVSSCHNEPQVVDNKTTRQDTAVEVRQDLIQKTTVTEDTVQKAVPHYLTSDTENPLRKELLEAMKVPVEKELNQQVQFKVQLLTENGVYAYLSAGLRSVDGSPFRFQSGEYKEAQEQGMMDNTAFVLCKKEMDKWKCIDFMIGCTDVCQLEWIDKYKLKENMLHDQDGNMK